MGSVRGLGVTCHCESHSGADIKSHGQLRCVTEPEGRQWSARATDAAAILAPAHLGRTCAARQEREAGAFSEELTSGW